ncbi:MAG: MBL fold metallo-hydrolase [Pirellulaceae bacterium]
MPQTAYTREIRGEVVFLGTGTSVGVPSLGCGCRVCTSGHPRNQRTRCAIAIGLPEGNLLIDTPADLRSQLLREHIGIVHAVLYTHSHADHLFGLDDLRLFPFYLGHPVPLFCESNVERRIRHSYDYAFSDSPHTHPGAAPQLSIHSISLDPFRVLGVRVVPLRLQHGPRTQVLGFRIGDFAYCTDTNCIPDSSFERLAGVRTFVVDALRPSAHPTHFNVEQAVAAAQRVGAQRTYLTHSSHELDYEETNRQLPAGIEMAYDGMRVPINLDDAL